MINPSLCRIVGQSKDTFFLRKDLERVAKGVGGVYLNGELGVGKELCARTIHELSIRREGPFQVIDCARFFPEDLALILFGSEKRPATSLLSRSDGGTLYIVHPEEMVVEVQERIAKFLSSGKFTLGASEVKRLSDVRILVGTEKDLEVYVHSGMIVPGIWDYLCANKLFIPPLRERMDDIKSIVEGLLGAPMETRFDTEVISIFKKYSWPGNYEELIEEVERLLRTGYNRIDVEHIRRDIVEYNCEKVEADPEIRQVLQEIEQCIQAFHVYDDSALDFAPYFWRGGPVPDSGTGNYDMDNEQWESDLAW